MSFADDLIGLPRAWPVTGVSGVIRQASDDFIVEEILGFEPDGEGQHAWLWIEKRDTNTAWLASHIADMAGVKPSAVSYAGLKDRYAVTRQWFSVDLAGVEEPDWKGLDSDLVSVLKTSRHPGRIRKGMHAGNRFELRVTQLKGQHGQLGERLAQLAESGVPNYFGEQRFGHAAGNLDKVQAMFTGQLQVRDRVKHGLYLSAARSWLFNQVLAERIRGSCWDKPIDGDVMVYDDGQTTFQAFIVNEDIARKSSQKRIHPTGPLWGSGPSMARKRCAQLESDIPGGYPDWCRGLEKAGLRQDRRSLRLVVEHLEWECAGQQLELSFELPAGGYATSVLRECVEYQDVGRSVP